MPFCLNVLYNLNITTFPSPVPPLFLCLLILLALSVQSRSHKNSRIILGEGWSLGLWAIPRLFAAPAYDLIHFLWCLFSWVSLIGISFPSPFTPSLSVNPSTSFSITFHPMAFPYHMLWWSMAIDSTWRIESRKKKYASPDSSPLSVLSSRILTYHSLRWSILYDQRDWCANAASH